MKKVTMFACLAMAMVFALSAVAAEIERPLRAVDYADNPDLLGSSYNKAAGDTIFLMGPTGSGAAYVGDWETPAKTLDPLEANGWSSFDVTQPTETHWQVSSYFQPGGDLAAWCGDITIPACAANDSVGGYGNSWHDILEFVATVGNTAASTTVQLTFDLQYWSEPGYDYTWLSRKVNGQFGFEEIKAGGWDSQGTEAGNYSVTYLPGEYLNTNEVRVVFRFTSDGGWSDADCANPVVYTAGACQVDNIAVVVTNDGVVQNFSDDFESGVFDGAWDVTFPQGAGDFTKVWEGLEDADPCRTNFTKQVAWIDDGLVVPGTGGSDCIDHCYGPSGYVVNHTGGLAGPTTHVYSFALSPEMVWPDQSHDGMIVRFTVFRHETENNNSTGVYYRWRMRNWDTTQGETADTAQWWSTGVFYGGPDYLRSGTNWTARINAGRDRVQIACAAYEIGWVFGVEGTNGTPAPYFDSIRVDTYPVTGPSFGGDRARLAGDNFPEIQSIDTGDLGRNHVRFDMAANISPPATGLNDPGDSISITCVASRTGAEIIGDVVMHWTLQANPTFPAGVRTATAPNPVIGFLASPTTGSYTFDLPDSGFMFPGDRLHYYFEATDGGGPLNLEEQTNTRPGDIAGYGNFADPLAYNGSYQFHALPTVQSVDAGAGTYTQPKLLAWNDFGVRGGRAEMLGSLASLGMDLGTDFDYYGTLRPDGAIGNGIGGRASVPLMEGYEDLFSEHGDLEANLISTGNPNEDAGNDLGLIDGWLAAGNKDYFVCGDGIGTDLIDGGAAASTFLETKIGVLYQVPSIVDFIGGQAAPVVRADPYDAVTQPVFGFDGGISEWVAFGGCLVINTFDGLVPTGGALRLAQFTDPNGNTGAYSYSAATLNIFGSAGNESRILSMPYAFVYIADLGSKVPAPKAARTLVLSAVLDYFGVSNDPGNTSDVPVNARFAAKSFPNPFNPVTKIAYTISRPGQMTLKVFNIRGELVKTLIDGRVEADGEVIWDGTNSQGGSVSSGVYFYEARQNGEVIVNKMALVK